MVFAKNETCKSNTHAHKENQEKTYITKSLVLFQSTNVSLTTFAESPLLSVHVLATGRLVVTRRQNRGGNYLTIKVAKPPYKSIKIALKPSFLPQIA